MKQNNFLFLCQYYFDAWSDYNNLLVSPNFAIWDYLVLTASNEDQAEAYRTQIAMRHNKGQIPQRTHYAVLPDIGNKRIGSGGATLNALRFIAERENFDIEENPEHYFAGKRILIIHSGGDSKRIPQYSACGKLFSPIPRELLNGEHSTLFDELMIAMSGVPGRIKEGALVLSGDVLPLFNSLQIDFFGEAAAAVSFKEDVETGKNHGVYRIDAKGRVGNFLHKQSIDTLRKMGAVDEHGMVDIDTGATLLSPKILQSLYGLISTGGKTDPMKFGAFVNDNVRLSFYGDFLYPLASESTLKQYYLEKPEGGYSEELRACRTALWEALRPYRMRLLRLSPAAFIHFGTTHELHRLMTEGIGDYSLLGWTNNASSNVDNPAFAVSNSVIDDTAEVSAKCYIENSYVLNGAKIGEGSILSCVTVNAEEIPENIVLHCLKQKDGRFVARIYGVADNPKGVLEEGTLFFGVPLKQFLGVNRITPEELWPDGGHYLWFADLYPVCDTIGEAVRAALNVYSMAHGGGDVSAWRKATRKSLYAGFNEADAKAIIDWEARLHKRVKVEKLIKLIRAGGTDTQAFELFCGVSLNARQKRMLEARAESSDAFLKTRIYFYMSRILGTPDGEPYAAKCFSAIKDSILQGVPEELTAGEGYRIARDEVLVKLPLRVNWGGGWSDTPPYCTENGGTVLNAAISLNGEFPVEVLLRKLPEYKVVLESADIGAYQEFTRIEDLQDCRNPLDSFALHKAALIACHVIPKEGGDLNAILARLGGGVYLSTQVRGVPMGSGLGTSSILSGACVKGVFEFVGKGYADNDLYEHVLYMEQIMSTGGGWQDQVGGLKTGIKYITSRPGLKQDITVTRVQIPDEAFEELNERFALIYTGQRRLARNLLREIIGRYIGANPEALFVLNEIQRVAALMRFELERGKIDEFAALLSEHWELSKRLDSGSTNTCIDQIFESAQDLLAGRMICGAGGGGFLQVILKKGATKSQLRERLKEVFHDSGVDVWDCGLVYT